MSVFSGQFKVMICLDLNRAYVTIHLTHTLMVNYVKLNRNPATLNYQNFK